MATKVVMAPAVCRMMAARPRAMRPRTVRNRPPADHGAQHLGVGQGGGGGGARQDGLTHEERRERHRLAHDQRDDPEHERLGRQHHGSAGDRGQGGTDGARSVLGADRRVPEDTDGELPEEEPVRLTLVGSNSVLSTKPALRHCEAWLAVARMPMPIPATTVARMHHAVERTERSLVHSDRSDTGEAVPPGRQPSQRGARLTS